MKSLFTLFIAMLIANLAFAQSTTITPGTVLPQMTTTQRTGLANPVSGMLVFDTNTNSYWFRQNTAWVELPKGGSTANYWQLNGLEGNEIKNTNSGGFWSANPTGLTRFSNDTSNPPTSPINGDGTRLMWIPSRSAFRVGTVDFNFKSWDADSIGLFSFATGYNAKAIGESSNAFGYRVAAIGDYSTAIGYEAAAIGESAFVVGENAFASGDYSYAIGTETQALEYGSLALGVQTVASGTYATAMGIDSYSEGTASTALGKSYAAGDYATSMGFFARAMAPHSTSVGIYNDNSETPDPSSSSPADRLFQIGNGSSSTSRSNALTVLRNGYIGTMNTLDPQANLHLTYAGTNNWDAHLRLESPNNEYVNIVYDNDGLKFRTWGATDDFYFRNSVNTTTARIYDSGNMLIAGTLTENSDRRLKKDITELTNSARKVSQLNGYNYNWIAEDRDPRIQTGLIAQEVQVLFPELVSEDENGFLSVNYIGLIPHLIEVVKELQKENNSLRTSAGNYEKRINSIESKLNLILGAEAAILKTKTEE